MNYKAVYTDYLVFAPQVDCPYCGTHLAVIWNEAPATGIIHNVQCAHCAKHMHIIAKLDGSRQGRKYEARKPQTARVLRDIYEFDLYGTRHVVFDTDDALIPAGSVFDVLEYKPHGVELAVGTDATCGRYTLLLSDVELIDKE